MVSSKNLTVLVAPNTNEAEELAKSTVSRKSVLLVVGRCTIDYHGRAESRLEPGERILLIKEDGSLLVHRARGYEPVNWMPGGDIVFNIRSREAKLEILAVRKKPHETVSLVFDKIQFTSAFGLDDTGEFNLYASEEDMQKAILLRPDLVENGFKPITYEKQVVPGFVDVYGEDEKGRLVVVEIKRKTANKVAVLQLAKYIEAIRNRTNREVRGILVAPSIGKFVQRTLVALGLEYKYLDPKKCSAILMKSKIKKLGEYFGQ